MGPYLIYPAMNPVLFPVYDDNHMIWNIIKRD